MNNAEKTILFFSKIDPKTKEEILSSIAKNYQINNEQALDEVTDEDSEALTEYLAEPVRSITRFLMEKILKNEKN